MTTVWLFVSKNGQATKITATIALPIIATTTTKPTTETLKLRFIKTQIPSQFHEPFNEYPPEENIPWTSLLQRQP